MARGIRVTSFRRSGSLLAGAALATALLLASGLPALAAGKWAGVDETVVEKYAKEHGRQTHAPLIDIGQGDMLLFAFMVAGSVGGFVAGYYWRMLVSEKPRK